MYIQMGNGKMVFSENCLGNKWKANVGIWLLLFVTPNEWIYLSTIYNFSFPQESDKWILWTFWWENTVVVLPMRSNWNPSKRLDLVVSLQGTQRTEESVDFTGSLQSAESKLGGGGGIGQVTQPEFPYRWSKAVFRSSYLMIKKTTKNKRKKHKKTKQQQQKTPQGTDYHQWWLSNFRHEWESLARILNLWISGLHSPPRGVSAEASLSTICVAVKIQGSGAASFRNRPWEPLL